MLTFRLCGSNVASRLLALTLRQCDLVCSVAVGVGGPLKAIGASCYLPPQWKGITTPFGHGFLQFPVLSLEIFLLSEGPSLW